MRKKTTKKILNPEHNKKIKKIYCFAIGIGFLSFGSETTTIPFHNRIIEIYFNN